MEKKIEIISRTMVKPSSPTPEELRNFKLSLLDQIIPPMYVHVIFFYPSDANSFSSGDCEKRLSDKSSTLRDSLSRTLTAFYPMAGQTNAVDPSIECSDDGAFFVEAKINCKLSEVLENPKNALLDSFLPTGITEEFSENFVTLIQLTGFECGGTALGVCLSHKLGDMSSLLTFLRCWSNCTTHGGETLIPPLPMFVSDSLLPSMDLSFMAQKEMKSGNSVTKRLVFEPSAIARLKAELGTEVDHPTSRVEVVLALILKCAMSAVNFRPSVLLHAVNLRRAVDPPLPGNSVGNLVWFLPVKFEAESEAESMGGMVRKMKKAVSEFRNEKARRLRDDVAAVLGELSNWSGLEEMEVYSCSSWCKFPLYETDFGWGKPIWVSNASLAYKNSIILMDTKEGNGIEAWVTLEEQIMVVFEKNQELLESASFNPRILLCDNH